MKRLALAVVALAAFGKSAMAQTPTYTNYLANEPALSYSTTFFLDLNHYHIDNLAMQAVYADGTPAGISLTDGSRSTGTVTVSTTAGLAEARATDTITVSTNIASTTTINGLANAWISVNGNYFTEGVQWTRALNSSDTANSITSAINASNYGVTAATTAVYVTSSVVTMTITSSGTLGNSYTLSTSTGILAVRSARFTGGVDNAVITINGTSLTQGTDWTKVATASGTAKAISDAIMANATLSAIIASTWTSGVVYATSVAVGVNAYTIGVSTPALARSSTTFRGGTATNILTASSTISKTAHGFTTGLPVLYTKSAGTSPGQLVANTTYYAIKVDADSFKLAATSTGAVAGTPVIAITTQTTAGGGTFAFTPTPLAGTYSFKWQGSNDSTNWVDLTASSVTYSTSGSTMWDGVTDWRYMRVNFSAGTGGGLNLQIIGYGKTEP